jgi:hypothetical protein
VLNGRTIGFVMAGSVVGAGLHELVHALIGGADALIKTASAEPFFYAQFAHTLQELDSPVASRIAVFNWGRQRSDLSSALSDGCDIVVAFGDDATIQSLGTGASRLVGYGSRVSGALVSRDSSRGDRAPGIAADLAREVMLFEQRGCLSPHHIFVEEAYSGEAHDFARLIAQELERLALELPPPVSVELHEAAAVRSFRESARWRKIGGEAVDLWEGSNLGWAVIYDRDARFTLSTLSRSVCVSPVSGTSDLRRRLGPAVGRLEGFAVADVGGRLESMVEVLQSCGVSYLCCPGKMQSPPLGWKHGGSSFIERVGAVLNQVTR